MRTVGNTERKVGALNQGYLRWQAGYDYIAGVDADTAIAPDCLQRLEEELAATPRAGGGWPATPSTSRRARRPWPGC